MITRHNVRLNGSLARITVGWRERPDSGAWSGHIEEPYLATSVADTVAGPVDILPHQQASLLSQVQDQDLEYFGGYTQGSFTVDIEYVSSPGSYIIQADLNGTVRHLSVPSDKDIPVSALVMAMANVYHKDMEDGRYRLFRTALRNNLLYGNDLDGELLDKTVGAV